MAIAKMSHIRLVGLKRDRNKIMDALTENGLFESRASEADCASLSAEKSDACGELKLKQSCISFALDFLRARRNYMAGVLSANARDVKKQLARPIDYALSPYAQPSGKILITKADFSDVAAKEYDLMHVCDELKDLSFALVDCTGRANTVKTKLALYAPYADVPIELSRFFGDGEIVLGLFYGKQGAPCERALDGLDCAYELRRGDGTAVITVCKKQALSDLSKTLGALGYSQCPFDDDCTAAQKIDALSAELIDIDRQIFELTRRALDYEKYIKELCILYDVLRLDIERAEAAERFLNTGSSFVLEGWLPEAVAPELASRLEQEYKVFVQLLAPEQKDAPPTLVVSSRVVAPYESITNMYSPPNYNELDPNPIMAIFFFLFFGIMIGDAAYGLVLAAAGLALGCSKKFDKGAKQLLLLVGMGGISAVIWGIMFGSYFAIPFENSIAVWFDPLSDPMTMLVLSVVLGAVQLCVGYIIKFVRLCIDGDPLSAVLDPFPIILLFAALACLGFGFALKDPPSGLSTAAIALAAAGLGMIVVFGGRKSKSVFGKVFGGLKGLYGLVNLFSDILSYCRLFGLGLASCAIGLAFNTLGSIIFDIPVLGYPLGILILIPLHAFNIGLGILGAYVHNARLQFLEFYGKFYDGGGRLFAPLGSDTKYIRYS